MASGTSKDDDGRVEDTRVSARSRVLVAIAAGVLAFAVAMFLTSETGEVRVAITPHPPIHVAAGRVMPPTERAGPVVAVRATRSRAPPAS